MTSIMTTNEAAEYIGCSIQNIRYLIRKGKLEANVHHTLQGQKYYTVKTESVKLYKEQPQIQGWKRGRSRR